jgi:hypothetical protein
VEARKERGRTSGGEVKAREKTTKEKECQIFTTAIIGLPFLSMSTHIANTRSTFLVEGKVNCATKTAEGILKNPKVKVKVK